MSPRFGGGATGGGGGGGLDPEEIREIVVNAVEAIVGDSVLADQPLMEAGIDTRSIMPLLRIFPRANLAH